MKHLLILLFLGIIIPGHSQSLTVIDGSIQIGKDNSPSPQAGTIRFNSATNDFEGFNGTEWLSLTAGQSSDTTVVTTSSKTNYGNGVCINDQSLQADWVVSIDSNWMVTTFPYYNDGFAVVFKKENSQWVAIDTLTPSTPSGFDQFGISASISGDWMFIGANFGGASGLGEVYIFQRSGDSWTEAQKILTPNANDTQFGYDVSVDGNYAALSSYLGDVGGQNEQGRVYIFYFNGTFWAYLDDVTASDGAAFDHFGENVRLCGDRLIVTSNGDVAVANDGKVYVFERSGASWNEIQIITSNTVMYSYIDFARHIDYDGSRIILTEATDGTGTPYLYWYVWDEGLGQFIVEYKYDLSIYGTGYVEVAINGDISMFGNRMFCRNGSEWQFTKQLISRLEMAQNIDYYVNDVEITPNEIGILQAILSVYNAK